MEIETDLIKNKKFGQAIKASLLKYSQEYRVLATLRYLFPQKYDLMTLNDSPDLQDCRNSIGIEVISSVREEDMKVTREFSKLSQVSDDKKRIIDKIEKYKYSLEEIQDGTFIINNFGTSEREKKAFQESINKKVMKFEKYKKKFNVVGLAILLTDIQTLELENDCIEWGREVLGEKDDLYDFIYVISHRFCFYYDIHLNYFQKWNITSDETYLLCVLSRMTAEGELTLDNEEWK